MATTHRYIINQIRKQSTKLTIIVSADYVNCLRGFWMVFEREDKGRPELPVVAPVCFTGSNDWKRWLQERRQTNTQIKHYKESSLLKRGYLKCLNLSSQKALIH